MFQTIIGWFAVVFHVSGYSFQSSKILKTKKTSSLSLMTFIMNFISSTLWLMNGLLLRKLQPVLVNTIVLSTIAIILYFILIQNFNWAKYKALLLMIFLLLFTWTLLFVHLYDLYVFQFVKDVSIGLQAAIAIVSGTFTIGMAIPQIIKMNKTKDTNHVSYVLAICYGLANVLWVIFYSTLFDTKPISVVTPIITAGVISAIFQFVIIGMKFLNEKSKLISNK